MFLSFIFALSTSHPVNKDFNTGEGWRRMNEESYRPASPDINIGGLRMQNSQEILAMLIDMFPQASKDYLKDQAAHLAGDPDAINRYYELRSLHF